MMSTTVYFVPTRNDEPIESLQRKTRAIFQQCGGDKVFTEGTMAAIKLHLGEKPRTQYIDPAIVRTIVDRAKEAGARPFLTDTCTLYNGRRSNAVDYLHAAAEHGFTLEAVGAPVIIADGLVGASQVMVRIDGKHFREVPVALDAVHADCLVVLTHVTGHLLAGFGGTIKNVSMGLCGRAAKLAMHSGSRPRIDGDKCGACGRCAQWCPASAIHVATTAEIDYVKCIGCGECYAVCRSDAVLFNWDVSSDAFGEKMAEACLAAVKDKPGRVVYLNYAIKITEQCDCFGTVAPRIVDDLGILASFDPVAVDKATADLLAQRNGKDVFDEVWGKCHYRRQLEYGQAIGLGSMDYKVVELKA
jgi:uncharacterized Fe-S center protein